VPALGGCGSTDPDRTLIGLENRLKGVLRRVEDSHAEHDEAFTTALEWERSWSLYSYERGNTDVDFHEITEGEAGQIVECIRRSVTASLKASAATSAVA
jgi:hypothetical protein